MGNSQFPVTIPGFSGEQAFADYVVWCAVWFTLIQFSLEKIQCNPCRNASGAAEK